MQLFAKYSFIDENDKPVYRSELMNRYENEHLFAVRTSFDSIGLAMNTIYLIIMTDKWVFTMYDNILPLGNNAVWAPYSFFFVFTQAIGSKVLLALFTAILLNHFSEDEDSVLLEEVQVYR